MILGGPLSDVIVKGWSKCHSDGELGIESDEALGPNESQAPSHSGFGFNDSLFSLLICL